MFLILLFVFILYFTNFNRVCPFKNRKGEKKKNIIVDTFTVVPLFEFPPFFFLNLCRVAIAADDDIYELPCKKQKNSVLSVE